MIYYSMKSSCIFILQANIWERTQTIPGSILKYMFQGIQCPFWISYWQWTSQLSIFANYYIPHPGIQGETREQAFKLQLSFISVYQIHIGLPVASGPCPAWGHVAERSHHRAPAPPPAPSPPAGLAGELGLPQSLVSTHTNVFFECLLSDVPTYQETLMPVLIAEEVSSCSCRSSSRALYLHPSPRSQVLGTSGTWCLWMSW